MTHLSHETRQAERSSSRCRAAAAVIAATVALLALTSGVAHAADTTVSFPVTGSTSILAPVYTGYGQLKVSTTCNLLTHYGAVSLAGQAPALLVDGIWVEASVYVKNHATPSYDGSLYLAHAQTRVYPSGFSSGVQINGYADLIGWKYFKGSAGSSYDVGVWYRYARPGGQWTQWYSFQETLYNTVVSSWGNVLDTATCRT